MFFPAELGLGTRVKASVSSFVSVIQKQGLARPTLYRVEVGLPVSVIAQSGAVDLVKKGSFFETYKHLHMWCEAAEIPGVNILTADMNYGNLDRKYAIGRNFPDVTMTFRVDSDMSQVKLFDSWQNRIVNPKTQDVRFKEDYVSDIKIFQLNEDHKITHSIYLINAFPVSIGSLPLSFQQQNDYHRLTVTFHYERMITSQYMEGLLGNVANGFLTGAINTGMTELKGYTEGVLGTYNDVLWKAASSGGIPVISG